MRNIKSLRNSYCPEMKVWKLDLIGVKMLFALSHCTCEENVDKLEIYTLRQDHLSDHKMAFAFS